MHTVEITPLYVAALTLLLVLLTLRVVALRWHFKVGIGAGEQRVLAKAIRAHANFVETVPFAVLLMLLVEMGPATPTLLHAAGASLLVGRLLHAFGLSAHAGTSFGRLTGTVLTVTVMLVLAGVLVGRALA